MKSFQFNQNDTFKMIGGWKTHDRQLVESGKYADINPVGDQFYIQEPFIVAPANMEPDEITIEYPFSNLCRKVRPPSDKRTDFRNADPCESITFKIGLELRMQMLSNGAIDISTNRYRRQLVNASLLPPELSRNHFRITRLRIEKLGEISATDAIASGLRCLSKDNGQTWKYGQADSDGAPGNDDIGWQWSEWNKNPIVAYAKLWDETHGKGAWDRDKRKLVHIVDFVSIHQPVRNKN